MLAVGEWSPRPPDWAAEVIVVAPHPDDEVIGAGMTMRWLIDRGCSVLVVGCTDGEGSHARSTAISPAALRARRALERSAAFELLGIDPAVHRLGLPDGELADSIPAMEQALTERCDSETTLLVPWEHDGHPDHRATAQAGAAAARRTGARLWRVPIWGKVRRDRPFAGRTSCLRLSDEARRAKAAAVAAFATQVQPVGVGIHDGPVVHPGELDRMLDGFEMILW